MQRLGPEQWQEWVRNDVTLMVMDQIRNRIEETQEKLTGPSNDRDYDQVLKGMIWAFNEVLDVKLETEEENEDEISPRDLGGQSYS